MEQFDAEAAVVELEVGAVISVPDSGTEEDDVPGLQVPAACHGKVGRLAAGHDRDLDEAMAVDLHVPGMDESACEDEQVVGEVRAAAYDGDGLGHDAASPSWQRWTSC